jgi:hypothetical protein
MVWGGYLGNLCKPRRHDIFLFSMNETDALESPLQFYANRRFLRPSVRLLQFLQKTCKMPIKIEFYSEKEAFSVDKHSQMAATYVFDLADHCGNVYFAQRKKSFFRVVQVGPFLGRFHHFSQSISYFRNIIPFCYVDIDCRSFKNAADC